MALYQKHRPSKLQRVKGNREIKEALMSFLADRETCPHVFLFHGETGCGKTTFARIVSTMLGCETTSSDYTEINFADLRGIDTVREIINRSQFRPIESECRVWVLDECQKMTGDAQNALLKILEDTPSHVYFILCTTEPQKLLPTIRGRCSQFQVKTLNEEDMLSLLESITKREGREKLPGEVYGEIIAMAGGKPRNAIQILEQVLASPEENQLQAARQSGGEQKQAIDLCRALLNSKTSWKEVRVILTGLKEMEPEKVRRVVLGYASSVLLNKDLPVCGLILEEFMGNFYDNGFPQLVYACYCVIKNR
jgi:DNA polymerase-3 subunit gamma/tau